MKFKNTENSFGLVTIIIHWVMALKIIGLFILGKYMLGLDYYDAYYQIAPWWHKSFGLLVFLLLLYRIIWKLTNSKVKPLPSYKAYEIKLAKLIQLSMYLVLLICCISGIIISTTKEATLTFFGLFDVPTLLSVGKEQVIIIEQVHEYSTLTLIVLASLHMLAALKHHFFDKDLTLRRILTTKEKIQ
jgi:cytochrome b561